MLKAGERESVAQYFEKAAALRTSLRDRMLRDAAAIRDGRMPERYQLAIARGIVR